MLSYTIFIYFTGKQVFLGQSNVNTYFESDIYKYVFYLLRIANENPREFKMDFFSASFQGNISFWKLPEQGKYANEEN